MVDRLFADACLARVYDVWHPREVRDDYDFYLPRIMAAPSVLDVGCGTGTLLVEARDAGHLGRLYGLDPASGMLDRARLRLDIEWALGELPSVGWTAEFDLIVMTGHAFQAIVEDEALERFLIAVREALVPGGRFGFDTRNPLARAWEQWRPENAVTIRDLDGCEVQITTEVVEPFDGRTVTFTHTFDGAHTSLPQVSRSTLRFLDADTLEQFLTRVGLRIEKQFGDFAGNVLSSSSPEIVTIAVA